MILTIRNQHLATLATYVNSKRIINTSQRTKISKIQHQFMLKHKRQHQKQIRSKLTFQGCFSYRSQERFIDFNKDYYEILGISESAELHQIKKAFYLLAKQYHPDRNKGNDTKFKEINQAYNVLSQPNLKKQYDSNRFRDSNSQFEGDEGSLKDEKAGKGSLNYGAYSQLSRAQWAIYRSGFMKHSTTDYTNYEKKYDQETDNWLEIKKRQQWAHAFRNMTVDQVKEEVQFRQKLYKKYCQDVQAEINAKEQYIDNRLKQIGNRIERFLGKRIRSLYDRLIQK